MTCVYCHKPIDPKAKNVWRKIEGWEKVRAPGEGVMPMKDRNYLGPMIHSLCLDVMLHPATQEALL